jgi:hypothetical protein
MPRIELGVIERPWLVRDQSAPIPCLLAAAVQQPMHESHEQRRRIVESIAFDQEGGE